MVIHKDLSGVIDEDDFDKLAQTCVIQGTVSVGSFPKWRQKGEDELVAMRERYLVVKINEANVFGDISDGGEALAWIDVIWGGVLKTTRKFKRANVNQPLYFKIPVPPDIKMNETKLEDYLIEELQTKSEFSASVWADQHKMTIDNIGMGKMCLAQIASHNVKYEDLEFVDPSTKEKYQYQARVYTGTIRLQSAYWPNAVNTVNASIWF